MAHTNNRKNWLMILIGGISLAGLLSYTWIHTGNLLASYVSPAIVGFLAAAGIELSIVGLSMRIGELKRSGLSYKFFFGTLVAVVLVSALANIAEGFQVKFGEALTVTNWQKLDWVQIVVSVAATGLISLVTLALSEIVGQDVSTAQKAAEKRSRQDAAPSPYVIDNAPAPQIETPAQPLLESPKRIVVKSYDEFKAHMNSLNGEKPNSIGKIEAVYDISHATAARYWRKYRNEHKIS